MSSSLSLPDVHTFARFELIHHAQLAWMPAEERRRYALTGPPPPDWFTGMQPAPWITGHVISEGRKLAGASLVRLPGDVPPDVPPRTTPPAPAQRPSDVPSDVPVVPAPRTSTRPLPVPAGRHRAPPDTAQRGSADSPGGRHRDNTPHDTSGPTEETVIVGIAAAARYLGYDKPDSFRRARTRHPIPGERKLPNGQPYWTRAALRSWQSKRKIAGSRLHGSEPG
jgi:hypothetical protein